MNPSFQFDADGVSDLQVLWEDGERVLCRGWRANGDGGRSAALAVLLAAERPPPAALDRLAHEYQLRDALDAAWAARPLALSREGGRMALLLEDPGGEPLELLIGAPMETGRFLRLAIGIVVALGKAHQRGLVHKDVKPANILANCPDGRTRLTGFGIASRLPRERQAPEPPGVIAGTLAYMAPEQTGRMNRSINSRSDLYALGMTLYEMVTGTLPFTASDPMELVHAHIARPPVPPGERLNGIPGPVSAMVMKLLTKMAEERYQTAAGVEHDLRRCLAEWERHGRVEPFVLGERDRPDQLMIAEKLYGREREVETLLASFDRIVKSGARELVLVSGYSGIGKSSVVNELHKALVPPRGLFASGKFDQYKHDIPYSTLAHAFQSLIRQLLGKSETDLGPWRDALQEALGPNAGLIVDLVPEVKLIIGEPPPVPELPPQDAQRRFQIAFRQFIGVFARPEHPLALFLDDLQWLDSATLNILEDLLTQPDVQHLLLIGAYRDNEVDSAHPLTRKLAAIRKAGAAICEITLAPLAREHLGQLIAGALRCELEAAAPLAQLVHEKTGGNPFFAIQFISALAEEKLLTFDHREGRWSWDIDRINAKGYTDNVVDLMVGKLTRLPAETQKALQQLACIGNVAEINLLAIVLGTKEEQVHADLWQAVRLELVERQAGSYKFVHDRVQEAAYSLIPQGIRAAAHLQIGRLLVAHTPPEGREEAIFDIVNQLNRGAPQITSQGEREQIAELNLAAGKRAKASTAYASALTYVAAGVMLLPEDAWERRQELAFALQLYAADCEMCTGALQAAEDRLAALATRAVGTIQQCNVAQRRADLYSMLGAGERAVAVGLECLRHIGIDWSAHPTDEETRSEYERFWSLLGKRAIEDIVDLPLMQDSEALATVDMLTSLTAPAFLADLNLGALSICRSANLNLQGGNSDAAAANYAFLALMASGLFGDYHEGYQLAKMACDLVERRPLIHFGARPYYHISIVVPWTRPLRQAIDPARRAFQIAKERGDPAFAAYSCHILSSIFLALGHPLDQVERELEHGLEFVRRFRFLLDRISASLALVRTLRGATAKFGSLDDGQCMERFFEERVTGQPTDAFLERYYWIRKLQARFFAGDYVSAIDAADKLDTLFARVASLSVIILDKEEYHFYAALSRAAACEPMGPDQYAKHRTALERHEQELRARAANCPQNFEDRAALVGAEIARVEGRPLDAMDLYERAIASARANGFVHNEALAYELAARFHAARGFQEIARLYLKNARHGYLRWGADGKVRQLESLYPSLAAAEQYPRAETVDAAIEKLDVTTVVKASQAVSAEIELAKLVERLMTVALENAGANRGLLISPRDDNYLVEAVAEVADGEIVVRQEPLPGSAAPGSVIRYVLRTRESVILDDARRSNQFAGDEYLVRRQPCSVFCLPLVRQAAVAGVLYLENTLTSHVFTPDRTALLSLLASQVAISLENTRLYNDLREREAKIRRLVDANVIGITVTDIEGQMIEANDAFLDMVGHAREELFSGHLRWTDLTPPEWHDRTLRAIADLKRTGTFQPYEKQYFRKDGSRVPVLVGGAAFGGPRDQAVAFVVDLTERKRAEEILRQLEADLAHMSRLSVMGELTASLAHEITQPIASAGNNARAALNFLNEQPPDLSEVREALACAVGDADRAGDIIERIRDHIKKAPPRKDHFDLNKTIDEVIVLARSATTKNGVSVETRFTEGLVPVHGDRVQLQQVVLNLILNAVEAMGSVEAGPRELLISTEQSPTNGVIVAVRDSGPGIDPEHVERVFEAFYTTKSSGVGMGLSICRSIIDAHGGRLWADANEPRGAVFQFTLPGAERELTNHLQASHRA